MYMFRLSFDSSEELADSLVSRKYIESGDVEEAFRNVDRARFVPAGRIDEAYNDCPLPISESATISAPHMVAMNTELLDVRTGDLVLEVGSGSGYQLAIISEITGDRGEVTGVEIDEELLERSTKRLSDRKNVSVLHGSGVAPVEGVFDRILFSCAINSMDPFLSKLKDDGVLVAPVDQGSSQVLKRYERGEVSTHGKVRFVEFQD
jgi:protein-L-isoaspartate(D-aspartate) O-methyltransferase